MPVPFSAPIASARKDISDRGTLGTFRHSDADLLAFGKDAIIEAAGVRGDLFKVDAIFSGQAGVLQQLPNPGRSLYVIEVYQSIIAGVPQTMYEAALEPLRKFRRTWQSDPAAQAENWMRYPREKRDDAKFFVYPPSPGEQQSFNASWVEVPDMSAYDINTNIPITDDFAPAIAQYIAHRAERVNTEPSAAPRAQAFYANFLRLLKANDQKAST